MRRLSPHGWVYGVPRKPAPARQSEGTAAHRLFAKMREAAGQSPALRNLYPAETYPSDAPNMTEVTAHGKLAA
jgi:hypothetical protein